MTRVCECRLNSDGHCPGCRITILRDCNKFAAVLGKASDLFDEEQYYQLKGEIITIEQETNCAGCRERYSDLGISKCVLPALADLTYNEAHHFLIGVFKAMKFNGITALPMTIKKWAELCTKNNWPQVDDLAQ